MSMAICIQEIQPPLTAGAIQAVLIPAWPTAALVTPTGISILPMAMEVHPTLRWVMGTTAIVPCCR